MLEQDSVQIWFKSRFQVARRISAATKNIFGIPKIWLLTGVYVIEDGHSYTVRGTSNSVNLTGTLPLPEPTGLAALLGLNLGATVALGNGVEATAETMMPGKKVWAAQWIRVKAQFVSEKETETNASALIQKIQLTDEWSSGTDRTGEGDDQFVQLTLDETEDESATEETAIDWNEEQRKEFFAELDKVDEHLKYII